MPIYDYVCASCRHRFEVLHGLNEAGPRQCPACGGRVSRAFAPPTILFKGTGWARVDRRSAGSASRRAGSEASDSDGGSGSASSGAARTKETVNSTTADSAPPGSRD